MNLPWQGAPYELSVQQDLPPGPNGGSQGADWLPRFAGSSWLAYAASSTIVIATAPSPLNPEESAGGRFFQQVLETDAGVKEGYREEDKNPVTSVGWAPMMGPSVGHLAAAVGNSTHIFSPRSPGRAWIEAHQLPGAASTYSGLTLWAQSPVGKIPLEWTMKQILEHTYQVLTFAWTDSGNGLLTAGSHVTMWEMDEEGFSVLWQVQCLVPQSLAASCWSSRGVVATANIVLGSGVNSVSNGDSIGNKTVEPMKGAATVWWWEEGHEIQGIELSHPSDVSMIQWRPSYGSCEDAYTFRPVLLTSSNDGMVRLWLDMEGPSYSSFCFGESQELKKKPMFSIGAVIEVNKCLSGVLGQNVFVSWASETRTGGGDSDAHRHNSRTKVAKRGASAPCEWLVGMGPHGEVVLWCIHSLDDILPTHSPRVTLWQKGEGLLAFPSTTMQSNIDNARGRLMIKAVVQRPEGTLAVPPSSLDVFEALSDGLFRWSRLWPPVSAIGTGGGHVGSGKQPTGNKSPWGVSSEVLSLDGHHGVILQVAMHPSTSVGLAASVDNQGVVLLWDLRGWSSPQVRAMSSQTLGWKLAGRISCSADLSVSSGNLISWAPISLSDSRAILIIVDSSNIHCFLVSRSYFPGKVEPLVLSDHLYSLQCPLLHAGQYLEGIGSLPLPVNITQDETKDRRFIVIGTGGGGTILATWVVEVKMILTTISIIKASEANKGKGVEMESIQHLQELGYSYYAGSLASQQECIFIRDSLIGSVELGHQDHVLSMAVVPGATKGFLSSQEEVYEKARAYDFLTGCTDGSIKLYRVFHSESCSPQSVVARSGSFIWQCVGVVWAGTGSVTKIASTASGEKIASVGDAGNNKLVKTWECDSYNESGGFELAGQIMLPQPIVSLSWLDTGMGGILLGVATDTDVNIYIQHRICPEIRVPRSTAWDCLASFSTNAHISNFLWGFQSSPILTSNGHIRIFGHWVSAAFRTNFIRDPRSAFEASNGNNHNTAQVSPTIGQESYTLLQAAEAFVYPLADYHPTALLWSCYKGDKPRARACIRHLARHLAANSLASSTMHSATGIVNPTAQTQACIPRMGLSDLLQKEVPQSTQLSMSTDSGYNTSFNFRESGVTEPNLPIINDKYSFLNNTSWLDEFTTELSDPKPIRGSQSQITLKIGGMEPLTKPEVEAILEFIEDCSSVPCLTKDEEKQLLAVVELLGEMDGVGQVAQCAGLDQAGLRYWLAYRNANLIASRSGVKNVASPNIKMESKAMAWALQSDARETLLDVCASQQCMWPEIRDLGVGFWFTDAVPLRKKMEKVARTQYMATKDAKESALLYIALERRTVLAGLLKMSKDERDRPLVDFLARDFQEDKHQAAALKNAYVLMGKHRHELAAAFFLLGGDVSSAASVCAKNLGDPQLGLVVCRLVEGSDGPIGRNLISKHVYPAAVKDGDYWLASLCQWLLGHGVETMHEVISGGQPASMTQDSEAKASRKAGDGSIPLDPDVGDYCGMLALKPRLRGDFQRAEVTGILRQAAMRAYLALRAVGLPLQALEYMAASSGILPSLLRNKCNNTAEEATTYGSSFQLDALKISQDEHSSADWIAPEVIKEVGEIAKHNAALQWMSQVLQEHPEWTSGQSWSTQKLLDVSGKGHNSEGQDNDHNVPVDGLDVGFINVEEAEKKIEEALEVLRNVYSLDGSAIVAGLVNWAQNRHRLYIYTRLLYAQHAYLQSPEEGFSLSSVAGASFKADVMGAVWKEAPWVLARIILATGSSVIPGTNTTQPSNTNPVIPWEQILELVRYGGDLQKLAGLLNKRAERRSSGISSHSGPADLKGKSEKAMILLAFVYYVGAAWLARNGKALVALVWPTICDPAKAPVVPATNISSVKWFQSLCSQNNQEKRISTTLSTSRYTDVVTIPEEESWRVIGLALWAHIVSYIKKQLAGTGKKTGYSGFGRVSVPQATLKSTTHPSTGASQVLPASSSNRLVATFMGLGIQSLSTVSSTAWSEIKNKMRDDTPQTSKTISSKLSEPGIIPVLETPRSNRNYEDLYVSLLSSIACISSGLQQQVAAHVQALFESEGNQNPLILWLWGTLPESTTNGSGPNIPTGGTTLVHLANTDNGRQHQTVVYPQTVLGGEDEACKELWRVLVVRDTIRSALAIEGVNRPSSCKVVRQKEGGWSGVQKRYNLTVEKASSSRTAKPSDQSASSGATLRTGFEGSQGALIEKQYAPEFQKPEAVFTLSGELIETFCINSCDPDQVVLASNRKGLLYLDLFTHGTFTETSENMLEQAEWPRNSWAGPVATPGSGLRSQRSSGVGLVGPSAVAPLKAGKEVLKSGGVSFGMPGYGGMGAWGGWEDWEDVDSFVDPIATVDNVSTKALAAHPSQPLFLVGSNNTHVYLWEYGKPSATATYGVLPAANMPPPFVIASVASVRFDAGGHRFVTAAMDGTVSTWQLEVGGRSNVRPTESCLFFGTHASDATFVAGSSTLVAATGMTSTGNNLIVWDTSAPPSSSRQSVPCHEGGGRCITSLDVAVGGCSTSPWIVSGGKGGELAVHDFRFILSKRGKRLQSSESGQRSPTSSSLREIGDVGKNGMLWSLPKAHSGSITKVTAVPGSSLFFTGSKDGDIKLWDVTTRSMVGHWPKVHERHTFFQVNSRSLGSIIQQVAVTDVQPTVDGFLTCGGDGAVKLFRHQY